MVHEIVEKLVDLPTLPAVVYELNKIINDPMASTSDVEQIMSNDVSLTTKVLRLANSAYYAIPGGVSSLQRAIAYVGYDTVNQLALSTSIIKALNSKTSHYFSVTEFWKHSIGVAMASEVIAREVKYRTPSDIFTCGLVHDIGKIVQFVVAEEQFLETVLYARDYKCSFIEAEEALEHPKHTQIGLELVTKWRLPFQIQVSVAGHHEESPLLRGGLSQEANLIVDIVFLANILIHALQFGHSGHDKVLGLPREVLERLGLNEEGLKNLVSQIRDKITNVDGFLKIIGD
jgi:putative nucleotidyltransferase with HDIG domain